MTARTTAVAGLLLAALTAPASGHSFLPAVVEIHAGRDGVHELVFRPPRLPPGDGRLYEPRVGPPCLTEGAAPRWRVRCPDAALASAPISLEIVAGDPSRAAPELLVDLRWPDGRRDFSVGAHGPNPAAPAAPGLLGYVLLGIEHILSGLDHLLFVVGLVALGGGLRVLLATVTAFTAGHCLTLVAIVLGWLRPAPAAIEILIAATLLFLGRVLTTGAGRERAGPRLAFVFGLVHGGGFAGALAAIGLPPAGAAAALAAFNLGIEAGQLLIVGALVLLALIPRARLLPGRRMAGYALGVTAAALLIQRIPALASGGP